MWEFGVADMPDVVELMDKALTKIQKDLRNHKHPTRRGNGSVTDQQRSQSCPQEFGYRSKVQEDNWLQEGGLFVGHGHKCVPRATSVPNCSIKGVHAEAQEEHGEVAVLDIQDTAEKWTDKGWDGICKTGEGNVVALYFFD